MSTLNKGVAEKQNPRQYESDTRKELQSREHLQRKFSRKQNPRWNITLLEGKLLIGSISQQHYLTYLIFESKHVKKANKVMKDCLNKWSYLWHSIAKFSQVWYKFCRKLNSLDKSCKENLYCRQYPCIGMVNINIS